jgi:hypothetical protein
VGWNIHARLSARRIEATEDGECSVAPAGYVATCSFGLNAAEMSRARKAGFANKCNAPYPGASNPSISDGAIEFAPGRLASGRPAGSGNHY